MCLQGKRKVTNTKVVGLKNGGKELWKEIKNWLY